ncbi:ASCH domain-containing protein [Streptomyces sennicomposti]
MTATLADTYDAHLYARARHEAEPTGALFTAPQRPAPLTPEQQRLNFELLGQAISSPHQAGPAEPNPTKIRALTIQPPWSDLIALTDEEIAKRIENRVWATHWRGTLLIHGGQTIDKQALALPHVRAALPEDYEPVQGHVVAVADLAGIHADDGACTRWSERGCFHWQLTNVQRLPEPVHATGSQRLWKPSRTLLDDITAANPHLTARLEAAESR